MDENINLKLREVSEWLPNLRPLTEFLHLNMFPGQQKKYFWTAIEDLSCTYSIIPLLPLSYYQSEWKKNKIDADILEQEIKKNHKTSVSIDDIKKQLSRVHKKVHLPEKTYRPIHKFISNKLQYSLNELTEPLLIRFLGNFFDQGIAYWKMPKINESILQSFFSIAFNSYLDLYPIKRSYLKTLYSKSASEIICTILSDLFTDDRLNELYIEESILSLKGWSGFISNLSGLPELVLEKRTAAIEDYLAIRLIIEKSWIDRLYPSFKKINYADFLPSELIKKPIIETEDWSCYKIWHEAYEKTLHLKVLKQISHHAKSAKKNKNSDIQAYFCIDDRECSLRCFIETIDPNVETFGTPGHFGLDFFFKENSTAYMKKHCPAPVTPQFVIQANDHRLGRKKNMFIWFQPKKNSIMSDFFSIFFSGFSLGLDLFKKTFMNKYFLNTNEHSKHYTDFKAININNEKSDTLLKGYTVNAAAQRLATVLKTTGGEVHFAPLIYIIGHESTTTNNAYFNAYGCGACSGRTGHINAITFCELANDTDVRDALRVTHQIHIPKDTQFIPSVHDTTKDSITYFPTKTLTANHKLLHDRFVLVANSALQKNAKLRCQPLELVDKNLSETEYLEETKDRASSIFEPRPELGHTGNAFCIIGQRSTTLHLSFDRRAFLQSYNWATDPNGESLNTILSAAIPVCGGINLDYFFSKMNNYSIGAGSKLSHNIIGLSALSNGTEDDLLTGLAQQMIELHEPIRIQFVVEQELEIVQKVIENNFTIAEWIKNEWIRFAVLCPKSGTMYYYENLSFNTLNFEMQK